MAAPDDTQLRGLINSNLPDSPPNRPRRIKAAILRATLFAAIDWVKAAINGNLTTWLRTSDKQPGGANTDSVYRTGKTVFGRDYSNGSGAALEASDAWLDTLNGNRVSPYFTITNTQDGLAATRYFAIGELPAGTGGTYDFARVEFVGKPWDNGGGSPIELDLYFANRGGFRYQYTSRGDANATGIICQQMSDGRTVIYMVVDNNFKVVSARFTNFAQAIIYGTPSYSSSLLGTEVFNSMKPNQYKPIQALRHRFPSFTVTNGDGGFPPAPISEPGAAQLSLGANWIPGSSELDIIHSNTSGGGIAFWQQTGASVKKLLGWLTANGDLILGGNGGAPSEKLHVIGNMLLTGILKFPAAIASRKLALYDIYNNDNQFFGFGVNANTLRYQVSSQADAHIFYAGTSSATSNELMRVQGDGKVGIGNGAPDHPLDVAATNPPMGVIARITNSYNGAGGGSLGAFLQIHQGGITQWRIGTPAGVSALAFYAYGNSAFPEVMRLTENKRVLIGTTSENDRDLLQVNGPISGKMNKQSSNPSSGETPIDSWRVIKNTSNGEVRLWVNDNGTMKSTLLS